MSEMPNGSAENAVSYSWSAAWLRALTNPSVATYELIIRDPQASIQRATVWVFICGTITYGIIYLLSLAGVNPFGSDLAGGSNSPAWLLFCAPILGFILVLSLAVQTGIFQLSARMIGGTGSYASLYYALGAYYAPLTLAMGIVFAIPIINFIFYLLTGLYSIVLSIIAILAVNQFGWGKAFASVVIGPILINLLISCGIVVVLSIFGQAIGDIFRDIANSLATPVSMGA